MLSKARVLFFVLLLAVTGGCAGKPVFTVEVYVTPTLSETVPDPFFPTAQVQPDPPATIGPAVLPTFAPAENVMPGNFSPILYGKKYDANTFFLLLGGVQDGKWLTPEQAATTLKGTTEYDVYTSTGRRFQVLGYAPESAPIRPGQYTIGTDVIVDEAGMVGVAHNWPVRQVQAQELPADNEIYRKIVADWLREAGVSNPLLDKLRIYRIDLEGDGVDEIFISATRLDESLHTSQAGDYSILLMRKVVGNEAVTLPLVADLYHSEQRQTDFPHTYSPANFLDLDQDGILEVILEYHGWEEDGALIYTIHGQSVHQIPTK